MNLPVNLFTWIIAALPIITLLILMVKFQWGAYKAAPIGLVIALISALTVYKSNIFLVFIESLKGAWSALTILIVVWTAILLYEVVDEAKAFKVFRQGMQEFAPNELIQIIILGWVFVSFLQGITGFGVPVAVGAPLLVGMGVSPLWAVFIPLIGHTWANTFGTLAVAWDALILQTDLNSNPELLLRTALWATFFIWIWNLISGVAICWFYGKREALKKGLPAVLIISLIHGGGQLVLSQINSTLAAFVPSTLALLVALLMGKTKRYGSPWKIDKSLIMDRTKHIEEAEDFPKDMSMNQAFLPYYVLTFITLFILLIPQVKKFFGQVSIGFSFPEVSTRYGYVNEAVESFLPFFPFTHAGTFLALSSLVGYLYYRKNNWIKSGGGKKVIRLSFEKTIPSGIAVLGFIIMSQIMSGSGQTVVLAQGISLILGKGYTLLAPVVGMLGAFMTSSNMASNILFGKFQLTTAQILNLDPAPLIGAQTAGGAIGGTIAPGNIILGATTTGILGQEGEILKKILPLSLSGVFLIGIILFISLVIA